MSSESHRSRMRPETYRRMLARLRQRRLDYLAGKVCCDCGTDEGLEVGWASRPGPVKVSKIWQSSPANRALWLPLTKVQCRTCRARETAPKWRNEHGGGAQGIAKCKCDLCLARRSQYMTNWARNKRLRQAALEALPKGPRGTMGQ